MKVLVKTIKKEEFNYDVADQSTVGDLRKLVASDKGVAPEQVKLIYSNECLSDDTKTLTDLGFTSKDFMVLVLNKRPKQTAPPTASVELAKIAKTEPDASKPRPITVVKNIPHNKSGPIQSEESISPNTQVLDLFNRNKPTPKRSRNAPPSYGDPDGLSDIQIQHLYSILNNDETLAPLLEANPEFRDKLKEPKVLMELLRRIGHPMLDEINETEPTVVKVTETEKHDLDAIKNDILDVMGPPVKLSEGQLNALIYQTYTMADKNLEIAKEFLINEFLQNNIEY